MTKLFESAWVIARRDFMATVLSRAFILFMLAPVFLMVLSALASTSMNRADREALRTTVALLTDSPTATALERARSDLVAGTSEMSFPVLQRVDPAENVEAHARELLASEESGFSGALAGTLDRPVLIAPASADGAFVPELKLLIERARTAERLTGAGGAPPIVQIARVETGQAAGSLRGQRHAMSRMSQMLIFAVTLMLATVLVSNFVEEKTSKIIEVLAAAVPLDAIFLGKLVATLAVSLLGIALWAGMLVLGYLFIQALQNWITMPTSPAIGWPGFIVLVLVYYTTNFMLLGAVFLGIGAQASNVKEVQTISMPLILGQLAMVLLAGMAISGDGGLWMWVAYIFPLSSPMAMVAYAIQSDQIWPHLVALAWQALWMVLLIRFGAAMFKSRVLKSGGKSPILPRFRPRRG